MSRSTVALFCVLSVLLFGCSDRNSPDALRARAEAAIEKREIRGAVIDLKSLLETTPKDARARWLLARCYVELGLGAAAAKELREARRLGYQDDRMQILETRALMLQAEFEKIVDAEIGDAAREENPISALPAAVQSELIALRGRAHAALGQFEQAQAAFAEAMKINPEEAEARLGLAENSFREKDYDAARVRLQEIIKSDPESGAAWSALGGMELQLRNVKQAVAALDKAIRFKAAPTVDLYRRALARIQLQEFDAARSDLRELARRAPAFYERHFAQGLLEVRQGNYKAAVEALQAAFNANPKFIWPRFLSAYAFHRSGQRERALEELKVFLSTYPAYVPARKLQAQLTLEAGDYASAKSALDIAIAEDPDDVEALRLLAAVYGRQGKFADQTRILDRVVELAPDSAAARSELGMSLMAAEDPTRGLAELAAARDLDPASARSDAAMIAYYTSKGMWTEATGIATALSERKPKDPSPKNLLGGIARSQGDEARARAFFEAALALDDDNMTALRNLASMAVAGKDLVGARKLYERILGKHPDDLFAQLRLAKLDGVENKLEDMVTRLTALTKSHPQAIQPRLVLARHYLFSRQFDQVAPALGPLATKESEDPWILDVLGRSKLALAQPVEAVQFFEKLVRVEPQLAEAHYLLARSLALTGDERNARAELDKTIAINPMHFGANLSQARLAIAAKDTEAAASLVAKLEEIDSRNAEVAIVAADLAALRGDAESARKRYERAFELDANSQTLITLASERWKAGARTETVKLLESWLESHANDHMVRSALASSYAQMGQNDRAITEYEKALKANDKDVLLLNNLASALIDIDAKRALGYAERAVALAPEFSAVLDTLALAQMKSGDVELARRTSDRLFRGVDPESLDAEYYYHRALVLQAAGEPSEAVTALQEGLALPNAGEFAGKREAEALLENLRKTH